jgi:hypothetical protein
MASGAAVEGRSEPEWRVEETDVLLRELVMRHSRNCPLTCFVWRRARSLRHTSRSA